jgi:hypothetical protein
MANAIPLLALTLIELSAPDGRPLDINPAEVSSVRQPMDMHHGHWAAGTRCVLVMTNGRMNAVAEPCNVVEQKLIGHQ